MRLSLQQEKVDLRLRIVTVPELQEEAQRNGMETQKNIDKSSNYENYVTCVDVCCFLYTVLELNWFCTEQFKRFDLTKGLLFDTFFITVCTNCVVVITQYQSQNNFHHK